MTDLCLINRTSLISDARFANILPALQAQCREDFCPAWGIEVPVLHFVGRNEQPDLAHWKVWFIDISGEAGALGAHTVKDGVPDAFVAVEDDIRYGSEISVTASHEVLEMLADPLTTRMGPTIGSRQYVIEVADATESDADGYIRPGLDGKPVWLSNFVLPAYFGLIPAGGVGGGPWDFLQRLTGPCPAQRPGGYLGWFDLSTQQWGQDMMRYADGTFSRRATRILGRTARRAARGVPTPP